MSDQRSAALAAAIGGDIKVIRQTQGAQDQVLADTQQAVADADGKATEAKQAADDGRAAAVPHASYAAALAAPKRAEQKRISALVGGRLVEWVSDPDGELLGGGWTAGQAALEHFGAAGDGVTNDINVERAAHAWATGLLRAQAVEYENKKYIGIENIRSIYGSGFIQTALWKRASAGTAQYPSHAAEPIFMATKVSDTDAPNGGWDSGAIYGSLNRIGGSAFGGAAVTGVATFTDGSGDLVGVHGRARVEAAGDKGGWGGWFYATDTEAGSRHLIGIEVNVVKKGPDAGWQSTPTVFNTSRGVAVTLEHDVTAPGTMGVYIGGRGATNPMSKWYTGLMVLQDAVMPNPGDPSSVLGNGEALRLQGASTYANRYGGLRFEKGNFQYGVSFAEATFAGNAAIILGASQRIVFGNRPGAAQRLSYDGVSLLSINEMDFGRNGVRLLTTRRTGWGCPLEPPPEPHSTQPP
ncbi:hypothetical protein ACFSYD_11730 [Paracoccus aerius]